MITQDPFTLFEKHPKCLIRFFLILAFFANFWPTKIDLSGNTQKLAKMDDFWHFTSPLSTQNVNVARFACNVE